jgi:predicted Fe-Mo cluster-binding NifX family protein
MEKYLIASSGNTLDSKVSGRFGHSGYFIILDPETMKFEAFSGVKADESAQEIKRFIQRGISKVIVGNIGPSTFYEIKSSGCTMYLCRNMTVLEAIKKVENGDVQPLKEPTLPESIQSARKAGDHRGKTGKGHGQGRGMGSGLGDGSGMGGGRGRRGGGGMGGGRSRGGRG